MRLAFGIDVTLSDIIRSEIRRGGPITAAAFIDLALYHPELGYYARTDRPTGRGGDFFTSVDVGPLFGELLAVQIAECFDWVAPDPEPPLDLVEAAAGHGRLARDILDTLARERPELLERTRLHLVERSPRARAAQPATLGPYARQLRPNPRAPDEWSDAGLPDGIVGVIYANELVDAFPVHVVAMRESGLREIFVGERNGALVEIEDAPSTPALQEYLNRAEISLQPGGRAEINLAAADWLTAAARALNRGFLILIDYGHEAAELFSGSHATGTLTTFSAHRGSLRATDWLLEPGSRDITSHVDLTSVRLAAERAGFTTLGITDQTYFLIGLGLLDRMNGERGTRTNQAKVLMLPGGLGSTHKVMIFAKGVGRPPLKGLSYRVRVT